MKTLEQQLSDYGEQRSESGVPITATELRDPTTVAARPVIWSSAPRWLVAVGAALVVLVVGALSFLLTGNNPAEVADKPPATVPDPEASQSLSVTWDRSTGLTPWPLMLGVAPIVSNGSSFLALSGSDPASAQDVTIMRSVDGVDWAEVEPPTAAPIDDFTGLVAVGNVYLMSRDAPCGANGQSCPLWKSTDGLNWEQVDSVLYGSFDLINFNWQVESYETILTTTPVMSNGLDGFYSVVMEFDDRLVQYRTEYPEYNTGNPALNVFVATVSTDGVEWNPVDPLPPFADALTDEYLRAGWQWMWRCEVAMQGTRAMMLVAGETGQRLWTTTNGLDWRQLPSPPQPTSADGRGQCIKPIGDGWLLTPGGAAVGRAGYPSLVDRILGRPDELLYSADGNAWTPITSSNSPPNVEAVIEVAGNTIFIFNPEARKLISTGKP